MTLELCIVHGSPYAWRVQLALEHKALAYTTRVLSYSPASLQAPDYLALNPRGKVPTLIDGDVVLYESIAILAYLERRYPSAPIMGGPPEESGAVWRLATSRLRGIYASFLYFFRFEPYFERLWFRPSTPVESSEPRTMW